MLYYIYLASSTPIKIVLGFFLGLNNLLLVDYIYI